MVENHVEYKVKGYRGRWGVADRKMGYVLLEHCTLGDETCYLVVSEKLIPKDMAYGKDGSIILPTLTPRKIYETWDDIETTLKTEGVIQ